MCCVCVCVVWVGEAWVMRALTLRSTDALGEETTDTEGAEQEPHVVNGVENGL